MLGFPIHTLARLLLDFTLAKFAFKTCFQCQQWYIGNTMKRLQYFISFWNPWYMLRVQISSLHFNFDVCVCCNGTRPTAGYGGWLGCGAGVIDHRHRRRRRRGGEVELLRQEGMVHVTYGDPTHGGQGNTAVGVLLDIPRLPYACHSTRDDEDIP